MEEGRVEEERREEGGGRGGEGLEAALRFVHM